MDRDKRRDKRPNHCVCGAAINADRLAHGAATCSQTCSSAVRQKRHRTKVHNELEARSNELAAALRIVEKRNAVIVALQAKVDTLQAELDNVRAEQKEREDLPF
jgi:hypothetical protein